MIEALLIRAAASLGIPEPLRRIAGYIGLALTVIALLLAVKAIYDANVVADHEAEKATDTIEARDVAASERAVDTIKNAENERERRELIIAAPTGQAPSDPARALACRRLRELGRFPTSCGNPNPDAAKAGTQ